MIFRRLGLAPPGSVRTAGEAIARVFRSVDTDGADIC
jgi:hypothetical protein